ncbi:supporter of activation of yellow protein isoform X2 [Thrips palmi]|uniref:Supporter of activation of yellow protein isoform X2 n=1 Tax=Thrips palmi TaxID=161013 RepID=A0A6P8YJ63_THRPL|nr:supporter of activation of yellow protein isoform X2 [Thrips palmi]
MDPNRPAFVNSLVAMYGSSPEPSDEEPDGPSDSNTLEDVAQSVEESPLPVRDNVKNTLKDDETSMDITENSVDPSKPTGVTQSMSDEGVCPPEEETKAESSSSDPIPETNDLTANEDTELTSSKEVIGELAQADTATSIDSSSMAIESPHAPASESVELSVADPENIVPDVSQPNDDKHIGIENEGQDSTSDSGEETNLIDEPVDKVDSVEQASSNLDSDYVGEGQNTFEKLKVGAESSAAGAPGRKLRQIRHPSAKAAEAAADAAFVAAVTPTRKNLKEAKQASALAKVTDAADTSLLNKKSNSRTRKGCSSSNIDSRSSPLFFAAKEDSSSNENSDTSDGNPTATADDMISNTEVDSKEETILTTNKSTSRTDGGKPVGIKLKISKESVQILDPSLSKLEVQIPNESASSEFSCSPGGTKRIRKIKEDTLSPNPPLSPITLKIAKSKEGLEVVSTENHPQVASLVDAEVAKVEKITLKLSRDEGATIVKPVVEELPETRQEKLTLKLVKDETSQKFTTVHSQDEGEDARRGKLHLKLSKSEAKRKEMDTSSSENDGGKLERITLKRSTDNNVSIVRSKDLSQLERSASASPEPGKVEKITLKVSKNDNVSIVKPASPIPPAIGVEKLTLKVSKDGTAAVSSKASDDLLREGETSKLEKITLKLSKEDGVSIVKPASPVPDKKSSKPKDEPLSPLSPLIIARGEEVEPQKERITLKLSKAGGQPSPVGVVDERSSWSIKSTDSDTVPSPVPTDPTTPKSRPKRALADTPENAPSSAKRLKLSNVDKPEEPVPVLRGQSVKNELKEELTEDCEIMDDENMDADVPVKEESDSDPLKIEPETVNDEPPAERNTEDSMDVILLDSEESQNDRVPPSETSIPVVDVEENEIPTSRYSRRKPRGRPRKAVLTPGTVFHEVPAVAPAEEPVTTPTKPKRERVRPEPAESDRPKRSCKGREKPPPKPPKPVKPRGRAAAAKQKAEQSMLPEEPQLFEEETRMSADCAETSTPAISVGNATNGLKFAKVVVSRLTNLDHLMPSTPCETPADSPGPLNTNEESQASQGSVSMVSSTTESTPNRGNRKGRMEINVDPDAHVEFTVDMIAEYMWPPNDGHSEAYMVQEQISSYLGVKSFKRKYPNLQRRPVDHDERQYLLERKLVSESLCDLGLTALPSHEVLDVLCTDFPEKFEEYRRFTRERAQREFSNKQKALLASGAAAKEDSKSKAMRNMASFNSMLNRNRRDQRRACFDLQSFTVHYPEQRRTKMTVPNIPPIGAYPLALVPGQYTDYYKEFTAAELRYFPLNTVLYGPLLPHEIRMHSGGSDGSQTDSSESSSSDSSSSDSDSSNSDSDSDSDSSSDSEDDSSSQVMPGALDSQEGEVERPDAVCRVCNGDRLKNKLGRAEPLVHCASCEKSGHLSCLDLTVDMMSHIRKYAWHCTDCKLCAQCNDTADEDKMLFCDMCDRGYHIYCVGLRKVPEGRWHCKECAVCASCAARDPGGTDASQSQTSQDSPSKSDGLQWQHEFKKGDKGTRIYVRTLCVPCSKLLS